MSGIGPRPIALERIFLGVGAMCVLCLLVWALWPVGPNHDEQKPAGYVGLEVAGNSSDQGGCLGGLVLRGGVPMAEAVVEVRYVRRESEDIRCETDVEGAFSFSELPAGHAVVVALERGRLVASSAVLTLSDGERVSDIRLDATWSDHIVGTVTSPGGGPAVGAQVDARGPVERQTVTDESGRFRLVGLAPGAYRISATAAGETIAGPTVSQRLDPGAEPVVELRASESFGVSGQVVDGQGDAVASARIVVHGRQGPKTHRLMETGADESGAFSLQVTSHTPLVLTGHAPGLVQTEAVEIAESRGARGLRIVLGRAGTIVGRATGRLGGRPGDAPDRRDETAPLRGAWAVAVPAEGDGPRSRSRVAEAPGTFVVEGLLPGRYDVIVRAPGRAATVLNGVELAAGATRNLGDVDLASGRVLVGRVVDLEKGAPVVGAHVRAVPASAGVPDGGVGQGSVHTDQHGRFRLVDLPAGTVALRVVKVGFEVMERSVSIPQESGSSAPVELAVVRRADERAARGERLDPAGPGIALRRRGDIVTISAVVPGLAAADAGLAPGTRVLSVDGYPADALPNRELLALLQGSAGTSVRIEVLGEAGPRGLVFARR